MSTRVDPRLDRSHLEGALQRNPSTDTVNQIEIAWRRIASFAYFATSAAVVCTVQGSLDNRYCPASRLPFRCAEKRSTLPPKRPGEKWSYGGADDLKRRILNLNFESALTPAVLLSKTKFLHR